MTEVIITLILQRFYQKNLYFCYTSVTKELSVRKFGRLIRMFVEVTWEKLIGDFVVPSPHSEKIERA